MRSGGWAAVVGPGAVGGVLAASLRRAGIPVRLAARRPADGARLARAGLSVTGPDGRIARVGGLRALSGRPGPGCAAVFVCVKSRDLRGALGTVAAASPDAPVVGLLNGVGHAPVLRRAVGPRRLVLGSCYLAAMRSAPGAVTHAGGRLITLAETPANRAALLAAAALLRKAGWQVRVKRDERRMLWTKLVFNAAVNPTAALVRGTNGSLAHDPALREVVLKALAEAARAASAAGAKPDVEVSPARLLAGLRAVPDQLNSMVQDLAAGRPTEAPELLDPLLRAARRARAPVPTLEVLRAALRRLDRPA